MIIKPKKLIIACDGESASGKSTAAKLISKKYKLLLVNSVRVIPAIKIWSSFNQLTISILLDRFISQNTLKQSQHHQL